MMLEVGGLIITSLVLLLCWLLLKSDRSLSATKDMIGLEAVAQENFVKEGFVLVRGELWRAKLRSGMVPKKMKAIAHHLMYNTQINQLITKLRSYVNSYNNGQN